MNRILINLPEVIETPKIKLQMPRAGFGERLHQAIHEGYEDYVKWLNWPKQAPTVQQVEEDCRKHHAEFILRDFIRYIIIDRATDLVVGRCAFPPIQLNWDIPTFGISYFIRKTQRANGFATEAANVLARIAFEFLKAKKVSIYSDAENLGSKSIPSKIGFNLEYIQRGGWPREDGELALLETYSIFTADDLPALDIKWRQT